MRLIFLDIDEVLNTTKSMVLAGQGVHPPGLLGSAFTVNRECVATLRKVVEELDLKIVLSSTWRHHPHAFMTAMTWAGWPRCPLIGRTGRSELTRGFIRGDEIDTWRRENNALAYPYVIVDDSVRDIHQKDHLVHVRIPRCKKTTRRDRKEPSKMRRQREGWTYGFQTHHAAKVRALFLAQEKRLDNRSDL
jgi:hypothetical protein